MELLYLWIEDDGMTIKNQSFNFSNHINFSFVKKSEENGLLTLTENPNFIDNFFGNSLTLLSGLEETKFEGRIVNVTGIIGENGVGKTNLLNFIIDLFTDRLPLGEKFVIAFKDIKNETIKVFHTLPNFELKISGEIIGFSIAKPIEQKIHNYPEPMNYRKDPKSFVENFGLIFYSPAFDLRNYPPDISNVYREYIDVSTNALIENDVIRKDDTYPYKVNEIKLHKFSNIRRQLDMVINSSLAEMKGVNLPKEVNIIFHRDYFDPNVGQQNLTNESEKIFKSFDKSFSDEWAKVNSILSSIDKRQNIDKKEKPEADYQKKPEYRKALAYKLKIEFTYCFIHNFFHNLSGHYNEDIDIKLEDIKGESLFERAKFFFENQKWKVYGSNETVQSGFLYSSVLNLIDGIDFDKNWIEDNANSFATNITGTVVVLSNYENYISSIPSGDKRNFLSTSWRNISSGENALMDLYSRLFFAKTKRLEIEKEGEEKQKTFLYILIDEGEMGFHPQWQSEYLYNLTNFIRYLFPNYLVQIIITSHSPFIVSDLPKENLVFLEKKKDQCNVVSFLKEQTFAANIHTLLADRFFMKDGVIGKFAKETLQKELKELLDNDNKISDTERLRKIISMIGEPVLQSKLTKMLNSKIGIRNV